MNVFDRDGKITVHDHYKHYGLTAGLRLILLSY
jgi:hypothetical protein